MVGNLAAALLELAICGVLIVSAVGKFRHPDRTRQSVLDLKVEKIVRPEFAAIALPAAEIVAALALLSLSGFMHLLTLVGIFVLFVAYLIVVLRALRQPVQATCACFGTTEPITRRSVLRNSLLVALVLAATVVSAEMVPLLSRLVLMGPSGWLTVASVGLIVAACVASVPRPAEAVPAPVSGVVVDPADLEDYVRLPIPYAVLNDADGGRSTLRELAATQARFVLLVSEGCGGCETLRPHVAEWARRLAPSVGFVVVTGSPMNRPYEGDVVHYVEPDNNVGYAVGMHWRPAALVLGMDGLLAGGPVLGAEAVKEFANDVIAQLDEGRIEAEAATDAGVDAGDQAPAEGRTA